jgi:hypothetical protein
MAHTVKWDTVGSAWRHAALLVVPKRSHELAAYSRRGGDVQGTLSGPESPHATHTHAHGACDKESEARSSTCVCHAPHDTCANQCRVGDDT